MNVKKIDNVSLLLIFILIVNITLKFKTFCGLVQADDFSYAVYSFSMFRIHFPWDMSIDFRELRYTLLLPVALIFKFFQPSETVSVLYPAVLSCGTIVMTYLIGKKIYGTVAGLIGAFIIATLPQDVLYGTQLMPDILVPFFLSGAVYMFLIAIETVKPKSYLWYALSGAMVFLAFNTRENSYYFLLFYLPFIFNRERWKNGIYFILAGFAVPVLMLYTFFLIKSGDFFYQLHLAKQAAEPLIKSGYIPANHINKFTILYYMYPFIFKGVDFATLFLSNVYGLAFIAGTPFLIYSVCKAGLKKQWRYLIVPWWFLLTYLYLEFGTVSFTDYQMMKKLPRFLLTMSPALAAGFGLVLSDLIGWGFPKITGKAGTLKKPELFKKVFTVPVLAVFFLFHFYLTIVVFFVETDTYKENNAKYRWAYYNVLNNHPVKPVYNTGGWWNNKLSFYFLPDIRFADLQWKKSDMLRDLLKVVNPDSLKGSYIIIDRSHFIGNDDSKINRSYDNLPDFLILPPKEWKLLGNDFKTEIYEVPESWKYHKPDPKELAFGILQYAIKIDDALLFYSVLHPDMTSLLSPDEYFDFYKKIKNTGSPENINLMNSMEYREYNGVIKLFFKTKADEGKKDEK